MSLQLRELRSLGAIGQGDIWTYRTEDDVTVGGYFAGAAHLLGVGDVIHVTVVTSLNKSDEAWVSSTTYAVTETLELVSIGSGWRLDNAIADPIDYYMPITTAPDPGATYHRITVWDSVGETYGDFPTHVDPYDTEFSKSQANWGHNAGVEYIGGLGIPISEPLTTLVPSATLTFRVGGSVTGSFTMRIRAVNEDSPEIDGVAFTMSVLHRRAAVGWTDRYVDFTPVATTIFTLDITDIINEVILTNGTTGTSMLFAFAVEGGTWASTERMSLSLPTAHRAFISVVPSLNHRDYQAVPLANTSVIFYWPFDAGTSAGSGNQSIHRALVTPTAPADKTPPVEVTDSCSLIPCQFVRDSVNFGGRVASFPSELEGGGYVRQFLGPPIDVSDPDKLNWNYGSDYRPGPRDYIFFYQFVNLVNDPSFGVLLDAYGDTAMAIEFGTFVPGTSIRVRATWINNESPYTPKAVTIADPAMHVAGTLVSIALWYDSTLGEFNVGYKTTGGWVWATPWADAGQINNNISGIQFNGGIAGGDITAQGWIVLEREATYPLADVAAAEYICEEMRFLWSSGVKALPPSLYA